MPVRTAEAGPVEPFLSRAVLTRLVRATTPDHWVVDGTTVFVDVSGFTKLSERLARRGREGAEDITETIDSCFEPLLGIASEQGGQLLKFGGDAMLLLFDDEDHLLRACAAADAMRTTLRTVGRIELPGAKVNLRMSVGIHTGPLNLFLVGESHHELIVTGPGASQVVAAEGEASAGQIMLSAPTVAALQGRHVGRMVGERGLLSRAPDRLEPVIELPVGGLDSSGMLRGIPLKLRPRLEAADLAPEHRIATVAFVQFGGTDALITDAGPAVAADALHELISTVQSKIDELDVGFLATDVAGDGGKIILTAGVPSNTGNDEERMLYALRQLAKEDLRLPIRMGVNRGPVFSGPVGPPRRRTYTVMGDTVNLAARVMAKARPGEVVATMGVLEESDTMFETELLEPFMVKGKAKPVIAATLGRRIGSRSRATEQARLPLVGREQELAFLQDALDGAVDRHGSMVELVGESGIGKSRLLEELQANAEGVRVIRGSCEAYAASTPYFPWRELLREVLDLSWDDPDDVVAASIARTVDEHDTSLRPWIPLLATPFDVDLPHTPEVVALGAEYRRPKTFEVVARFLEVVLEGPALMVLEDAHWMDEASCALLDHVSTQINGRPWLCCVMRQEGRGGFVARLDLPGVVQLAPGPLRQDDARALALTVTQTSPVGPSLLETLTERSGGNPQYLRDLAAAAAAGEDEALPESIEAAATARIDRLSPGDRTLVRRAALLGVSFHTDLLTCVLPDGAGHPDDGTWVRLDPLFSDDGDGYRRFRSEVVRDAAYGGLPYRLRRDLHSTVARRIEEDAGSEAFERAESLSLHYHLAGLSEPAWRWSTSAGDRAVDHDAHYDAARFYRRAIEIARSLHPPEVEVASVFERLGDAYDRSGQFDRAHVAFDGARRRIGSDTIHAAGLLERHAQVAERAGHFLSAVRWANRGLRILDDATGNDAARRRARLLAALATIRMRQRRLNDAERLAREAIAAAEASGELPALARACQTLEVALVESGRQTDGSHARRALELFEELGDLFGQSAVLNNNGAMAYWEGRWSEAVDFYERATEASTRAGMVVDAAFGDYNVGEILVDQGHIEEGIERMCRAEQVWRGTGDHLGVAFARSLMARATLRQERYAEARDEYEEAIQSYRALRADADARAAETESLECLLGLGEVDEALAGVESLLATAGEVVTFLVPGLHRTRGLALALAGRRDEAQASLLFSLTAAEERSEFEVARTLDALIALDLDGGQVVATRRQIRDAVWERLGVVRPPALPPGIAAAVSLS
jgi:predicted ATPase/class 3 adenylate cyclase